VCVCVCVYTHTHTYVYTHIYKCIHTHTHTYQRWMVPWPCPSEDLRRQERAPGGWWGGWRARRHGRRLPTNFGPMMRSAALSRSWYLSILYIYIYIYIIYYIYICVCVCVCVCICIWVFQPYHVPGIWVFSTYFLLTPYILRQVINKASYKDTDRIHIRTYMSILNLRPTNPLHTCPSYVPNMSIVCPNISLHPQPTSY
jgi:hypothetical protein